MTGGPGPSQCVGGIPRQIDLIGSPVAGGGSVTCAIAIDSLPLGGTTIQVSTDHPNLLGSPSGTWPYTLTFAEGGGTTAAFPLTTQSVPSDTEVEIYACES